MPFHKLIRSMVAAGVTAWLSLSAAHAQQYPIKPIKLLVGFSAGGATDAIARLYGQKLSELLNTPVVVENKPGGGQLPAIRSLRLSPPDGYTLLVAGGSALTQGPAIRKDLGYDPLKDLSLIAFISTALGTITVNSNVPAKSIEELVSYAKAHPGEIKYASAGVGSAGHLEAEYFMKATGTKMTHIPYKSDADAMRAVIDGSVQLGYTTSQIALPLSGTGKARALLNTTSQPLPYASGVPTLADTKVEGLRGLDPYTFFGLVGPAGVPAAVIEKLNEAVNRISAMPDVADRLRTAFYNEPVKGSPAVFRAFVEKEYTKWREIGKSVKLED